MIDYFSDDLIDFDDLSHTYTNSRTKEKYISVTTFIKQFEPEFDTEYWSLRKAIERVLGEKSYQLFRFKNVIREKPKDAIYTYLERSPLKGVILTVQEEIKREWKDKNRKAINKGSAYHARQEDKLNFNKFRILNNQVALLADTTGIPRSGGNKINLSYNLPDGAYAEILMKNHSLKLSGQADYVYIETSNGIRYMDIDDYKTNEKLTDRNQFQNFLAPISFLEHHKMNVYKIQLLLYAYMAEQYGFVVRNITITYHPNINAEPIIYNIYRQPEVIKLLTEARKRELRLLKL